MNENAQLAEFANNLWNNFIKERVKADNANSVMYYRAEVVSNPGNNRLVVQRPFDEAIEVSCTDAMSSATAGTQVLVIRFGNGTNNANHLVMARGDGMIPGAGAFPYENFLYYGLERTLADLNGNANNAPNMSAYYISSITEASGISNLAFFDESQLITIGGASDKYIQFQISDNKMYFREYNGTWQTWRKAYEYIANEATWTTPSATSLNNNANNANNLSAIYISSSLQAGQIANIPVAAAGHLITVGGTSSRYNQFYCTTGANSQIYQRIYSGSWSAWKTYVPQTLTTTWTAPTVTGGLVTISGGGYYTEGKRVYVQLDVANVNAMTGNTLYTVASGFPAPSFGDSMSLACAVNGRPAAASITNSGSLILSPAFDIVAARHFRINGSYVTA